ncbi:MAG TPA: acetate--CoA ligase family protein, partial [Pyrinomonadaceae bacterium]
MHAAQVHIPSYSFPETAAIALARATRYRQWRDRRETFPAKFEEIRTDEAAAVVAAALTRGEGWLTPAEVARICSCYGLPLIEQRIVSSVAEASAAAAKIGGEIALKAIAPGLVHKTEAGAVKLHLNGADAVSEAAAEMSERLSPSGFVVQKMARARSRDAGWR